MKKIYFKLKSFAFTLGLIGCINLQAQIINPATDGGFELGTTFTANGWTVVNTTTNPYNAWWVGTAPTGIGSGNIAYISNDIAGTTHNYSTSLSTVVHFYKDVTIPAGDTANLQFDIIVNGENNWDLLQVSLAPTTITPTASTTYPGSGTGAIVTGATVLGNYTMLGTTSQTITIPIPLSVLNNCSSAVTVRLIFSWKSDTSVGTQPPAAIDNISLISAPSNVAIPPSPTATGDTVCGQGNVTLTANGTGTLLWYNDSIGGSPIATGTSFTTNITATDTFYVENVNGGCPSARTPVIAVSTPADSIIISASSTNICSGDSVTLFAASSNSNYTYVWSPIALSGDTVGHIPSNTTTYIVSANDTLSGCATSDSITVNVNQYPTFTLSANQTTICEGNTVQLAANTASSYCSPTVGSTGTTGDYIDSFEFADLSNLSTGDNPSDYQYYNNLTANVIADGVTSYTLTVTPGTAWAQQIKVWIDFNQNGIFEASETVFGTTTATTSPVSTTITIPNTAINGITRMRVACRFSSVILDTEACGHSGFGEYEDYNVSITGGHALTYAWTPAGSLNDPTIYNPLATPTTTTTYYVDVTNSAGCTTSDSILINVNPSPVVNLGNDTVVCGPSSLTLDAGNPGSNYLWNDNSTNQTLLVTTNGIYYVTVTETLNNCSSSDTINVSFGTPTSVTLPADTAICAGSSLTIDAGAGYSSYNWSNGDQTQTTTVNTAGSFTVTVTNSDGCSASDTIVVTLNALPAVNLGNDTTVCNNQNITLDAGSGFNSYSWTPSGNTQTITVTDANTVNTYSVTVTDSNGCSNSDTIVITFNSCTGIENNSVQLSKLEIYPNPSNGNFTINFGDISSDIELKILDMNGKLVYSEVVSNNTSIKQINIEKLPAGIYMLTIGSNNEIKTLRISKY